MQTSGLSRCLWLRQRGTRDGKPRYYPQILLTASVRCHVMHSYPASSQDMAGYPRVSTIASTLTLVDALQNRMPRSCWRSSMPNRGIRNLQGTVAVKAEVDANALEMLPKLTMPRYVLDCIPQTTKLGIKAILSDHIEIFALRRDLQDLSS